MIKKYKKNTTQKYNICTTTVKLLKYLPIRKESLSLQDSSTGYSKANRELNTKQCIIL